MMRLKQSITRPIFWDEEKHPKGGYSNKIPNPAVKPKTILLQLGLNQVWVFFFSHSVWEVNENKKNNSVFAQLQNWVKKRLNSIISGPSGGGTKS